MAYKHLNFFGLELELELELENIIIDFHLYGNDK